MKYVKPTLFVTLLTVSAVNAAELQVSAAPSVCTPAANPLRPQVRNKPILRQRQTPGRRQP